MSQDAINAELDYCDALSAGIEAMGLAVSPEVVVALGQHYRLLCHWAARINLTSITDPVSAAQLHGLDCRLFAELFAQDEQTEVADVGSGAGFPGIVLALARPALKMHLIEPRRKRCSFLQLALAKLQRPDVIVHQSKLLACSQKHPHPEWQTEIIVSRASLAPARLLELSGPYLRPGGRLITTSGEGAAEQRSLQEIAKRAGFQLIERHSWQLPGGQTRILDEFTLTG
jgi:16S rRNA (guanine527-N7)-methyltransferase